ncbi:hypothetical protein [Shimia ponticola]|uniref:hypothetical protein n=1 Tax=Shimia ponticola TaxID=2582893 RepID=UPI0011BE1B1C|nr:hypothetical protein [Shimia ponticola]
MITSHAFTVLAAGLAAYAVVDVAESLVPVVWRMKAEAVSYEAGTYTARVSGYKLKDCLVVPGSFIGWYRDAAEWREVPIAFPDDASPDSSNPAGWSPQSFGLFEWSDVPEAARKVKATLVHNCDGHLTVTTVGPFRLDKEGV